MTLEEILEIVLEEETPEKMRDNAAYNVNLLVNILKYKGSMKQLPSEQDLDDIILRAISFQRTYYKMLNSGKVSSENHGKLINLKIGLDNIKSTILA